MKAKCLKTELLTALQQFSRLIPARPSRPILAYAKLKVTEENTFLYATDLENAMQCVLYPTSLEEPGEVLIPVIQLRTILTNLPDEIIDLESTDHGVCLFTSNSPYSTAHFDLPTPNPDEYPPLKELDAEIWWKIPGEAWKKATTVGKFAASAENPRYVLSGIHVEIDTNQLCLVATDGRRMMVLSYPATMTLEPDTEKQVSITLPIEGIHLLNSIAVERLPLEVAMTSNDLFVARTARATVWVTPLAGRYPLWRSILDDPKTSWEVQPEKKQLQTALKAMLGLYKNIDITPQIKLTLSPGQLMLTACWADCGHGKITMPIEYDDLKKNVSLNGQFLLDAISGLEDDFDWFMRGADKEDPIWIEQLGYLYLIMPMQSDDGQKLKDSVHVEAMP